jgi:3alpha(or 20beta)-hydroxysteroid dehydrogenase
MTEGGGMLTGKVAIVTGAAQGMGESFARALAEAGARVLVADINGAGAEAVAASIGANARAHAFDVTSAEQWGGAIAAAEAAFGPVSVLVNNAGIAIWGDLEQCPEEDARRMIDVDVLGVFQGIKAIVPAMRRAGGGSIINIASCAAMRGVRSLSLYTACKWAVRGMTKCVALEVGDDNIRVNAVHPGMIDTAMTVGMDDPVDQPIKRKGSPAEVAQTVVFLASDASSYTTGCDFVVDGGLSICSAS